MVTHRVVSAEPGTGRAPGHDGGPDEGRREQGGGRASVRGAHGARPDGHHPGAGQVIRLANQRAIAIPVAITVLALVGIALLSGSPRKNEESAGDQGVLEPQGGHGPP